MTDLFNNTDGTQQPTEGGQTPTETPNYADLLASIKNENGEQKFKTLEDLAKGYSASQDFISTLKTEKTSIETQAQELAGKLKTQEELQELLKPTTPPQPEVSPVVADVPSTEDIAAKVMETLSQQETMKVQATNVATVKEAMKNAFGADANAKLEELTAAKGLDKATATTLAQSSPTAFLELLGVEGKAPQTQVTSSVLPGGFQEQAPTPIPSVMAHAKTEDIVAAWSANTKAVNEKLGVVEQ